MISADSLARLLRYSFPVVIIVTVCIVCIVSAVKNKKNGVDTTPRPPFGLRPPTDEEAKVNRNRANVTGPYRRAIYVPRDQFY